mmetsp:Transcript_131114/g.355909  ORF Transcript_131114/g.355909 Transcript_131114/m.355909 type:complete len:230 (+) Transcript_131114:152-841(+)
MGGEQAAIAGNTSVPLDEPGPCGGTADLEAECDVADEFSSARERRTAAPSCADYRVEPRGSLTPRKSTDRVEYDPCNPIFVRPATELEKVDADLALLRHQLARLRPMVARRCTAEPCCPIVQDYQHKVREMEFALQRAEGVRACLVALASDSDHPCGESSSPTASDLGRGEGSRSTSEASSWSDLGAAEASGDPIPARMPSADAGAGAGPGFGCGCGAPAGRPAFTEYA